MSPLPQHADHAWLRPDAGTELGSRAVALDAAGGLAETVRAELETLTARHGGSIVEPADAAVVLTTAERAEVSADLGALPGEGFALVHGGGRLTVVGSSDRGLLYGYHHVRRAGSGVLDAADGTETHAPTQPIRMLDHWDNVAVHPGMGQVERGYAGGSLFYDNGRLRPNLSRVEHYARLLASVGINRVALNNVNVHALEARLLTDGIGDVVRLAEVFRPQGIAVYLSVSFNSPVVLGGLPTADPLDESVRAWWAGAVDRVYDAIPDFGGFVVKADSEGQPGPFGYGRSHADGANMLAKPLARHGGDVFWRAFVYNHRQDWRDRSTDRARAAYDHFAPLDGTFDDNVVLQVKHGPMDFQVREPVSPVIGAMPTTRLALELQVTQEYTGQQQHVCYLAPLWSQVLDFPFGDDGAPTVGDIVSGSDDAPSGGVVAVSNVGGDEHWTGHPFAQANLYALGRLAWDPTLDAATILDEWLAETYDDEAVREAVRSIMTGSWQTYERYTAPLGVGWMVRPGRHYGPDVDGYEYTPWGTYHFADRDGIGVDRTVATGTGYAGMYPEPWACRFERPETTPDELLLFFHHVPYTHRLHSGTTVIQHIYDTHFEGVEQVERMVATWESVRDRAPQAVVERVQRRLEEQLRSAVEWRDQINTYFYRKSGIPDEQGRTIH
ncbi:xylan alpha-(1-_2)-glucuronosidase [Georgenia halophila]|uniref:Xylan alpha-(1->2)-glucuronosidase n=1 Tax=Georgenia halophila TaxID=620889 RepID=A0ABP8LHJ4_9MICO